MKKRGQLGLPFNWIFILIAGAVILGFFFSIVFKQKSISEQKINYNLVTDLEAIASSAAQAKDTVQSIDLPAKGFDVECSDECTCTLSVGGQPRDFKDKIIFAPSRIEGREVVFWTLDWSVPYRATNFLYAATERTKFYLIRGGTLESPPPLVLQLQDRLPDEINYDVVHVSDVFDLRDKNFVKAKFVFVDVDPSQLRFITLEDLFDEFEDADPSAVYIQSSGGLTFYDKRSRRAIITKSTASWAQEEMMIGAIFADDFNNYACSAQAAFQRLHYVGTVYTDRTEELALNEDLRARGCNYDAEKLRIILDNAHDIFTSTREVTPVGALWQNEVTNIAGSAADLEQQNQDLLRKSCPTIY